MDRERIVKEIMESNKYGAISPVTINRLIDETIPKFKKEKDVVKYVKKNLHIIWGAFFNNFNSFEKEIENAEDLLQIHKSTEERTSFVKEFYKEIFNNIPISIKKVADYGCGLNPINIPSMNLPKGTEYYAYDIYVPEIEFLNEYAKENFQDINFKAIVKDIFEEDSNEYDVVFLLKILPVLEEQRKGSSREVLSKLNVKYFVVSFPLKSLGGRNVGMESFYTKSFESILLDVKYDFKKIMFENEVVYIVRKS